MPRAGHGVASQAFPKGCGPLRAPGKDRRQVQRWLGQSSDLQPRLLQVELALDPPHHLGADLASVPKPDELLALGGVDLVHHPLVGAGALLDPVAVLDLPRSHLEAPLAEAVEGADSLDGPIAGPLLALQLVDPL